MDLYKTDVQKALEGATISHVELEPNGTRLTLTFVGRPSVNLVPYGECCSATWIESLDAPDALIGTVQSVEEIPMPDLGNIDGNRHQGVDQVSYYGLKIATDKGVCIIDYRNDSNGYYGGSLEVEKARRP